MELHYLCLNTLNPHAQSRSPGASARERVLSRGGGELDTNLGLVVDRGGGLGDVERLVGERRLWIPTPDTEAGAGRGVCGRTPWCFP